MDYSCKLLDQDDLLRAYPLACLADARLTLEGWLATAKGLIAAPPGHPESRGMVGVAAMTGHLHALFAFEVTDEAGAGRTLACSHLVFVDCGTTASLLGAVVAEVDRLSAINRCRRVRIDLAAPPEFGHGGRVPLANGLRRAGFDVEALRFVRDRPLANA